MSISTIIVLKPCFAAVLAKLTTELVTPEPLCPVIVITLLVFLLIFLKYLFNSFIEAYFSCCFDLV